ncbi:aminotransferase class V [Acetobacter cibinongensis]|uniref:Aminotransferase class V n=2 Tax=Acetobacter cibinongensis TaxID=146475 RepID=A0A0D6N6E4_9PROT|nr:cysteine desulfurase SufS, pyridoxal 5'-phosphate (PLP)-dependent [Acetobacter cibinongensis]GBQ12804.1 NifS-like protein [Acetobacter cibinongensis NRIC 0482]GEL58433.1 aminotransferase class V [Acetobacter cibinongensis]
MGKLLGREPGSLCELSLPHDGLLIMHTPETLFPRFAASLQQDAIVQRLGADVIGDGMPIEGPYGVVPLIYADYVASGRALGMIEQTIAQDVLPYYANSHTEASLCGQVMNRLRHAARQTIARLCGAEHGYATIFAGNGATAGLNKLVHLLGVTAAVKAGQKPLVLMGPYEHHSNILPWRESGASLIELAEAPEGGPDMQQLEDCLRNAGAGRLVIGAFSAASNVTGIVTDVDKVTRLLKSYGAKSVWDYAGAGPYLPISMQAGTECEKDAVVISTHKFIGGPGASGVLIVRDAAVEVSCPSAPGGGTVKFVSPWGHDYSANLVAREEAGTPDIIGNIRAALCFMVKDAIGQTYMAERNAALYQKAYKSLSANPHIQVLGNAKADQHLPIFSFRIKDDAGMLVHHQLFTRMLSDRYGIQARGGCACAGPYAHRLLGIEEEQSRALHAVIQAGQELEKPGWVRLNFSVLMSDEKVEYILSAVNELADMARDVGSSYHCDAATARFRYDVAQAAE